MVTQSFVCCAFPSNTCQKSQAVTFLRGSFCLSPQHGRKLPAAPAAMHWYLSRFKAQEWRERDEAGCFVFLFRKLFPDICALISSLELCPVITHSLKQMEIDFIVIPYTLYDKGRKFNKRSPRYMSTSALGRTWRSTGSSPSVSVCFSHSQLFSLRICIQKQWEQQMVLVMLKATLTAGEIHVLCDQRIEWGRGWTHNKGIRTIKEPQGSKHHRSTCVSQLCQSTRQGTTPQNLYISFARKSGAVCPQKLGNLN